MGNCTILEENPPEVDPSGGGKDIRPRNGETEEQAIIRVQADKIKEQELQISSLYRQINILSTKNPYKKNYRLENEQLKTKVLGLQSKLEQSEGDHEDAEMRERQSKNQFSKVKEERDDLKFDHNELQKRWGVLAPSTGFAIHGTMKKYGAGGARRPTRKYVWFIHSGDVSIVDWSDTSPSAPKGGNKVTREVVTAISMDPEEALGNFDPEVEDLLLIMKSDKRTLCFRCSSKEFRDEWFKRISQVVPIVGQVINP